MPQVDENPRHRALGQLTTRWGFSLASRCQFRGDSRNRQPTGESLLPNKLR